MVNVYISIEHDPWDDVSFPVKNGGFFDSYFRLPEGLIPSAMVESSDCGEDI